MASSNRYALNKNKYLLDPEYDRLHRLLSDYLEKDRRNALLLFMGLYTGARASEILNLKFEDLNFHDQSVFIHGLKGSNDRELPLPNWLFTALRRYCEVQQLDPSSPLFDISYNRLRQIWEFYRPIPKKFHSLRHTFAIRLYKKSKDLRLVQFALGHRNINNTMIYAEYAYSQSELRKMLL